jgi:hypothetical protein
MKKITTFLIIVMSIIFYSLWSAVNFNLDPVFILRILGLSFISTSLIILSLFIISFTCWNYGRKLLR